MPTALSNVSISISLLSYYINRNYTLQLTILLKLFHRQFILLFNNSFQLIYLLYHFNFIILFRKRDNFNLPHKRPYRTEFDSLQENKYLYNKTKVIVPNLNSFLTNTQVKFGGFIILVLYFNSCRLLHLRQQFHHLLPLFVRYLIRVVFWRREGSILHLISILT